MSQIREILEAYQVGNRACPSDSFETPALRESLKEQRPPAVFVIDHRQGKSRFNLHTDFRSELCT